MDLVIFLTSAFDREASLRVEGRALFGRQLLEPVSLGRVVLGLGLILQAGTVPADEAAGATLRQPKALNGSSHGGAASFRR